MSHNIGKIIYINLERRNDRKIEIENELNNFSLSYERLNAIEYKGDANCQYSNIKGLIGCGYSHLEVLKLAKERNYKNVLILEDDFMFLVSKDEFENQLTKFFDSVKKFDVCMLSYNVQKDEQVPEKEFINRVLNASTASAYLVNNHYYDKLIALYENALPLLIKTGMHWIYANDQIWKVLQTKDIWYRFNLRIGKQRPSYSDNTGCFMDHSC